VAGPEREIALLLDHRAKLVVERTRPHQEPGRLGDLDDVLTAGRPHWSRSREGGRLVIVIGIDTHMRSHLARSETEAAGLLDRYP